MQQHEEKRKRKISVGGIGWQWVGGVGGWGCAAENEYKCHFKMQGLPANT